MYKVCILLVLITYISWKVNRSLAGQEIPLHFTEHKGSLPRSQ